VYGVAIKGKGKLIHYAIQHAGEIVKTEEEYYGIPYPWKKLSLIAVPDFSAGAMENPGAITFRSSLLLFNPKTAPMRQIRGYWVDTAHELGHMWTGDLVTVPWWNDIWLNEAFATWMEQKVMMKLHPDWNPKMDIYSSVQDAMRADSLASTRRIRQPIENTGDIKNAFDAITYSKGASVIRMFENYLGPKKFRKGMHNYLARNANGSANLDDFLNAISDAAGKDIAPAFKTFLNQPGLPLVEMKLKMDDGKPTVHLAQSRYLPLGSTADAQAGQWQIPVCVRYPVDGKVTEQCDLFSKRNASMELMSKNLPAWFLPNAHGLGYYQWSLGKTGYQHLTQSLDQLSAVGQMSLANSIEAAFDAGKIDTVQAMKALAPFAHSKHEAVAEEPIGSARHTGLIGFAHEWLTRGKSKKGVEAYARKLYGGYDVAADFQKGHAPKDTNKRQFHANVARFLARTGRDSKVRKAADAAAGRLLGLKNHDKPSFDAVASDFIPVALAVAVQDEGKPVFDALNHIFQHAQAPFVRNATLGAMASATDPKLAKRVRAMTLDPKQTKINEIPEVLFVQFAMPETRDATWQWTKKHYDQLTKRLPEDFGGRLPMLVSFFCSNKKADAAAAFFKPHLAAHPGSQRNLQQAEERAHLCAAKRKAQSPSAEKFFSQF
jgi:alanyl aminopeptidase